MKLKVIYEPKGRAGEYADLAANLYRRCDGGCQYCWSPLIQKISKEEFHGVPPVPRKDIIKNIQIDAEYLSSIKETRSILLCFTCDPYCLADVKYQVTRRAINIFLLEGLNITILTKGGLRSMRDFDIISTYKDQVTYACTLVFENEQERQYYEKGSATPTKERIKALMAAHDLGLKTWASLEPVFEPDQTMELIWDTKDYVDLYKVGTLNYHERTKIINWTMFRRDVIALLESLKKPYYIKQDLWDAK
ncbi:MAG: hypothetical protein MUO73_09425 [Thermoplasmata archaeon]|nr:hypothetical protein [Thermoplasmata archaeon]